MSKHIKTTTGECIRLIAEGAVERGEAMKTKNEDIREINCMTLNYFIGACNLANALGLVDLKAHIEHVILNEVSIKGFQSAYDLALKTTSH